MVHLTGKLILTRCFAQLVDLGIEDLIVVGVPQAGHH
jgi:dTDP-glucose pyrophosphorylase